MKQLGLLYPFTPRVIGVNEGSIAQVHDNGLIAALRKLQWDEEWLCSIHYLTDQRQAYSLKHKGLDYFFHPVSRTLTTYLGRPELHRDPFGAEWSLSLAWHTLTSRADAICFFISAGWFPKFLALLSRLRRRPYLVIMGGRGMPRGRSQRCYLEGAHAVLVHTERQREWLYRERGVTRSKTRTFPIGVDTAVFQPRSCAVDRQGRAPHLLYVGRLVPSKGLLQALQAFAEVREAFPQAEMTVVGPWGDEAFESKIERFIQQGNLTPHISFTGPIPNDRLPHLYQRADLLLFPSQSESFGIVVVESMACATPVIAVRNSGGPDEIISHGDDGLLVFPSKIGSAAIGLLRDPERLASMSQAARRKVEAQYSLTRTYRQLKGLLGEMEWSVQK